MGQGTQNNQEGIQLRSLYVGSADQELVGGFERLGDSVGCTSVAISSIEEIHGQSPTATTILFLDVELCPWAKSPVDAIRQVARENFLICAMSRTSDTGALLNYFRAGAVDAIQLPATEGQFRQVIARLGAIQNRRNSKLWSTDNLLRADLNLTLPTKESSIQPAVALCSQVIRGHLDERERERVELGLHEIIRNAYEHGNLGITFDDKTRLCDEGLFEAELQRREAMSQYSSKHVRLSVSISSRELVFVVEDQGVGFAWQQTLERVRGSKPDLLLHGRGLVIIASIFDVVEFNPLGNSIRLMKSINGRI